MEARNLSRGDAVDAKTHWEAVYTSKAPDQVSWYRPHLDSSLALIERVAPDLSTRIVDVGGGASTLVDDLLLRGYNNITVVDVSPAAIETARRRLGAAAGQVRWLVGDITSIELESGGYDVWHDRAVFHFLTAKEDRTNYLRQLHRAVTPGGSVIVATFGPEGPTKCSGLEIVRYSADSIQQEFGAQFELLEHFVEQHRTPFGTTQQFLYCLLRRRKNP